MAKTNAKDLFSNIAYGSVTASAANTLTFAEINTGVSVHEKIAWVINRILWYPAKETLNEFLLNADVLDVALCLNNKVSDLSALSDPAVIDLLSISILQVGTPASAVWNHTPIIRDFSRLPGGGLIITPKPLYVAAKSAGFTAACVVSSRIFYTVKELAADEFWELVQASRIVQ